jgi:FkbM family methyltransferase
MVDKMLNRLKHKIYYILKVIIRSSQFGFFNRLKLILNCLSLRMKYPFFRFFTPENIEILTKNEVPVYVDNFIFGEILEPIYLTYLKSQNSPVVVDIGCNTGLLCEYFIKLIPNGRFYVFDMMKECLEAAQKRLSKYCNSVHYFNFALGDENKKIEVSFDDPTNSANSILNTQTTRTKRVIEMKRLDDVPEIRNLLDIDLLKIDVEGYEIPVLSGALATIKKARFVIVEIHLQKHLVDYSEILNIFTKCNHVLYQVKARNLFFKRIT